MKKLTLFFTFAFCLLPFALFSQAPHKFNYQAVARNGSAVLENETINVKFEIRQGSPSGFLAWGETHMNVTTTSLGLFSLEVGDLVSLIVDWTDGPYYLDVELDLIDGSGFRDFGNVELLSVPYAMFAETANGPWSASGLLGDTLLFPGSVAIGPTLANGTKLAVQGDNLLTEDPLFEVKRQDGQTVFAVYNDSIRMYVDASPTKGNRGGFAIGGFTPGKGPTNDYFMVSPDSVRVYIDQTQTTKGSKGGFAIGGFTPGKGEKDNLMYLGLDNYFIGHQAGESNTDGEYNTFFGYQAGMENTIGNTNSFLGYQAGLSNTTGSDNVFIGNNSGSSNTNGFSNVFIGNLVGTANIGGDKNVYVGDEAGISNTHGSNNIFIGFQAGNSNTMGGQNIFIGNYSGSANQTSQNLFIGEYAGEKTTSGTRNSFVGFFAGQENLTGAQNAYFGQFAGMDNTKSFNTLIGYWAGGNNVDGEKNAFLGYRSGQGNNGSNNVFLGYKAGEGTSGTGNVFLGFEAGSYEGTKTNTLYIANSGTSTPLIWGDFSNNLVNFNGRVGIGNANPAYNLFVRSSSTDYVAGFDKNNAVGSGLIRFMRQGSFVGNITESGGAVSYNAFTGSHLATSNEELGKGMLVSLSGISFYVNNGKGEPVYDVSISATANNPKIMGTYLYDMDDEEISSKTGKTIKIISAVGNGEMLVTDKGEDLNVGDYLISSEVSGHAMKDIGKYDISHIIGRVAEPVKWADVSETVNGVKHKQISVFFESFEKDHRADKLTKTFNVAIQEQQKQIEELKAENAVLAAKINNTSKLEAELAELKALVEQISLQQTLYTQKEGQE